MMLSGKLDRHLAETEKAATERMEVLMEGLLERYPAPDKKKDQMAWAAHMNSPDGPWRRRAVLQGTGFYS